MGRRAAWELAYLVSTTTYERFGLFRLPPSQYHPLHLVLCRPPSSLFINFAMGVGRAVWENTNKAIFADVFSPADAPSAFAGMYMITGMLTFTSLFVFPNIPLKVTPL